MKEINNSLTNSLRLCPWRSARSAPRNRQAGTAENPDSSEEAKQDAPEVQERFFFFPEVFRCPNGNGSERPETRRTAAAPTGSAEKE